MSDLTADDQPLPTARAELALLQALCEELTGQGRPANLVRCWLHDEFDVRLVTTGAADGGPDVELLGPYAAAHPTPRWCAVQVCADARLVWAGPPRSCAPVDLLRFIDDLLQARAPDRTADYERLGQHPPPQHLAHRRAVRVLPTIDLHPTVRGDIVDATTPIATPESLRRAQEELDRKFDEIAKEYAGHPRQEVLSVLEREVCAAGVTPTRPDLSALARQISAAEAG